MSTRTLPGPTLTERMAPPATDDPFGDPVAVDYTFAFVDICGFTTYCEREGEHAAIELLTRFRFLARSIAVRRGVRVAKWLGDGVMLVAADQGPMIATAAELLVRSAGHGLDTHVGIARGPVLLFEGDDYVGRSVNLAARLCDAADRCELLAHGLRDPLPPWVHADPQGPIVLGGLGPLAGVSVLHVEAAVASRFRAATSVA